MGSVPRTLSRGFFPLSRPCSPAAVRSILSGKFRELRPCIILGSWVPGSDNTAILALTRNTIRHCRYLRPYADYTYFAYAPPSTADTRIAVSVETNGNVDYITSLQEMIMAEIMSGAFRLQHYSECSVVSLAMVPFPHFTSGTSRTHASPAG